MAGDTLPTHTREVKIYKKCKPTAHGNFQLFRVTPPGYGCFVPISREGERAVFTVKTDAKKCTNGHFTT